MFSEIADNHEEHFQSFAIERTADHVLRTTPIEG